MVDETTIWSILFKEVIGKILMWLFFQEYPLGKDIPSAYIASGITDKFSNVIDVIKCSGDDLFAPNYLTSPSGKSKYLLGTFLTDD